MEDTLKGLGKRWRFPSLILADAAEIHFRSTVHHLLDLLEEPVLTREFPYPCGALSAIWVGAAWSL
jgi:hypothetical protein